MRRTVVGDTPSSMVVSVHESFFTSMHSRTNSINFCRLTGILLFESLWLGSKTRSLEEGPMTLSNACSIRSISEKKVTPIFSIFHNEINGLQLVCRYKSVPGAPMGSNDSTRSNR